MTTAFATVTAQLKHEDFILPDKNLTSDVWKVFRLHKRENKLVCVPCGKRLQPHKSGATSHQNAHMKSCKRAQQYLEHLSTQQAPKRHKSASMAQTTLTELTSKSASSQATRELLRTPSRARCFSRLLWIHDSRTESETLKLKRG